MNDINCRTEIKLSIMDRIRVFFGRKLISRVSMDTFLVDEKTLVKIDKNHSIVDVEKTKSTVEVSRFFC